MPEPKRQTWLGGYIREGKRGPTFVIERWIGGIHLHVSTKCRTERAALKELERFEMDPLGYDPRNRGASLTITLELTQSFRAFMRDTKHNSPEWVSEVTRHLGDWAEDLGGKDLRRLTIGDLKRALDERETSRKHRTEAIKAFCAWLRKEKGLLTTAEDRTLDLAVPQGSPAKLRRRRVVADEHIRLVAAKLPPETLDVLTLQLGTSWHISEARRFAESGEVVRPLNGDPLAVLCARHKSGEMTRTPIVEREHLEAAERLRARGRIPIKETLVTHLRDACEAVREEQAKAGVPEKARMPHWRLGDMRHTGLTYAVQQGASGKEASEFAAHRSERTTRRHYIDLAIPTVRVPVRTLKRET